MEGKDLIIKMLNLLVEMAEYCINKDKPKDNIKCADCALCWNFSLSSNGCFLVETIAHNDKFIEDLESVCIAHDIDYKDKLNKIADIFITESE